MPCSSHLVSVPPSTIACWLAVSFAFSVVVDEVELELGLELELAVLAFAEGEPVKPFNLSESPQNDSAKRIKPNDNIDFIKNSSGLLYETASLLPE